MSSTTIPETPKARENPTSAATPKDSALQTIKISQFLFDVDNSFADPPNLLIARQVAQLLKPLAPDE